MRDGGDAEHVPVDGPLLGLGIDLSVSLEQLRTAAADAPAGVDGLCDTLLGCFGRDQEDDIAMPALRLG